MERFLTPSKTELKKHQGHLKMRLSRCALSHHIGIHSGHPVPQVGSMLEKSGINDIFFFHPTSFFYRKRNKMSTFRKTIKKNRMSILRQHRKKKMFSQPKKKRMFQKSAAMCRVRSQMTTVKLIFWFFTKKLSTLPTGVLGYQFFYKTNFETQKT